MEAIANSFDRQVLLVAGRNEEARDMALANYKSLQARKGSSLAEERRRERGFAAVAYDAAFAYAVLRDFPSAETWARRAVEHMEKTLPRAVNEVVTYRQMRVLLAYAVARQGRREEAAKDLAPDLEYLRGLLARGTDDFGIHVALAQAEYVAAVATPSSARALLAQAAARIDAMPRDITQRKSVMQLRGWIAEEQRRAGAA
jgi:tetratricopeptide (TPR) repeat protein